MEPVRQGFIHVSDNEARLRWVLHTFSVPQAVVESIFASAYAKKESVVEFNRWAKAFVHPQVFGSQSKWTHNSDKVRGWPCLTHGKIGIITCIEKVQEIGIKEVHTTRLCMSYKTAKESRKAAKAAATAELKRLTDLRNYSNECDHCGHRQDLLLWDELGVKVMTRNDLLDKSTWIMAGHTAMLSKLLCMRCTAKIDTWIRNQVKLEKAYKRKWRI